MEPEGQTESDLKLMREANTLVLAYVSIMELGDFHPLFSRLEPDDFLVVHGKNVYKEAYRTYVLNLTSKRWRGLLLHHIGRLLLKAGYDGIFMDTIGDVESPELPAVERDGQMQAAAELVKDIRRAFPEHVLVQNNGLEALCTLTAPYLDGLCWENPPFARKESMDWCHAVLERTLHLQTEFGLRVLLLHEENLLQTNPAAGVVAQTTANKHHFLYYRAPTQYLSLPRE